MKFEPYQGDKPYIFVSYAHKNKEQVWPILKRMISQGFRIWYDEGIDPGTEWDTEIAQHIDQCDYFISFISEAYCNSDNCRDELSYSRDLRKKRLLVYLEDVALDSGLAMRLNRIQAIHKYTYKNEEDFYKKLFRTQGISLFMELLEKKRNKAEIVNGYDPEIAQCKDSAIACSRGDSYYEGKGVQRDYQKALEWYLKAEELGYTGCLNRIGWMYESGKGCVADYRKAREYYERSVKTSASNSEYAAWNLGSLYYDGKGVSRDYRKALEWYLKAEELGHTGCLNRIGFMYESGKGCVADYRKAREYYERSVETSAWDSKYAASNLGDLYYGGKGVILDYGKALEWYLKAEKMGHTRCLNRIGWMYESGKGCVADYRKAREYYERSVETSAWDSEYAASNLGDLYYGGKGVRRDYRKALEWYLKAEGLGHTGCLSRIGFMYEEGLGCRKDLKKAQEYYEKAKK